MATVLAESLAKLSQRDNYFENVFCGSVVTAAICAVYGSQDKATNLELPLDKPAVAVAIGSAALALAGEVLKNRDERQRWVKYQASPEAALLQEAYGKALDAGFDEEYAINRNK